MAIVNQQTTNANTPVIQTGATALAANTARVGWIITNVGTNPLYVLLGSGASTTVYHISLKGGTVNDDATGTSFVQTTGVVYTGIVTVAGTSPRYTVVELAP